MSKINKKSKKKYLIYFQAKTILKKIFYIIISNIHDSDWGLSGLNHRLIYKLWFKK